MMAAPGIGGRPSAISTGVVPAGLSARNASRRSQARSSTSRRSRPYSPSDQADEARMRTKRVMKQREHAILGLARGALRNPESGRAAKAIGTLDHSGRLRQPRVLAFFCDCGMGSE